MISLEKIRKAKRRLECAKSVLDIIHNDYNNPNGSVSERVRQDALECVANSLEELDRKVDEYIQTR